MSDHILLSDCLPGMYREASKPFAISISNYIPMVRFGWMIGSTQVRYKIYSDISVIHFFKLGSSKSTIQRFTRSRSKVHIHSTLGETLSIKPNPLWNAIKFNIWPRHTSMFIAIIGTRLSGKSSVETYLAEKGFIPVRVISRSPEYGDRAQARGEVSRLFPCLVQPPQPS